MIGDTRMERSQEADGSPLLKTNKKQAACQERLRPVSLKLFIHHAEMRQHLLLQPWCVGAEAIRQAGGLQKGGTEGGFWKERKKRYHWEIRGPTLCPALTWIAQGRLILLDPRS